VTFATDTLTINLPAGSYNDGQKYCIVVAQAIPDATTINAPVVVTIGDGTVEYPLLSKCGAQLTAAALRTRTRYATIVSTNATGGAFKLLGNAACAPVNNLTAIDGTDTTTTAGGGGA
jgi:3-deoxy-D-manno-octulosonate 8-phosphate phosphatase KdsC-like HAD superfamily phosphatase